MKTMNTIMDTLRKNPPAEIAAPRSWDAAIKRVCLLWYREANHHPAEIKRPGIPAGKWL